MRESANSSREPAMARKAVGSHRSGGGEGGEEGRGKKTEWGRQCGREQPEWNAYPGGGRTCPVVERVGWPRAVAVMATT